MNQKQAKRVKFEVYGGVFSPRDRKYYQEKDKHGSFIGPIHADQLRQEYQRKKKEAKGMPR